MSFLGSIGSSLASGGLNLISDLSGGWATNSAKESLNKNIGLTNLKLQKKYDVWTQDMDKAYEQWWQEYLYGLQKNQYYNLAKQYALNTASWAVEGLKRAGLNPILAGIDSNLSSSMGNANPQSSGHSTGGGSVRGAAVGSSAPSHNVDIAGALQKSSAAEQAKVQTDIAKDTKPDVISNAHNAAVNSGLTSSQISASTAESLARAKLIDAQAQKTTVDTINAERNSGLSGFSGAAIRSTREFGDAIKTTVDKTGDLLRDTVNSLNGVNDAPSSAKGHSDKDSKYPRPPEIRILHDGEKAFLPPDHVEKKPVPRYEWKKR